MELVCEAIARPEASGYHAIVATEADAPAGADAPVMGYVCFGPTPMTEHTWDLYWIAVAAGLRGRGTGRRLLEACEAAAALRGGQIVRVEASSVADAPGTLAFYNGTGFVEAGRIPDFYRPGDDLVIFYRRVGTPLAAVSAQA